jgi:hypothetical protein
MCAGCLRVDPISSPWYIINSLPQNKYAQGNLFSIYLANHPHNIRRPYIYPIPTHKNTTGSRPHAHSSHPFPSFSHRGGGSCCSCCSVEAIPPPPPPLPLSLLLLVCWSSPSCPSCSCSCSCPLCGGLAAAVVGGARGRAVLPCVVFVLWVGGWLVG